MDLDAERMYGAIRARDPRFDGWFITAVTSTYIYCRPSCPAQTPKRENVRFYPTAAAAQAAGFRACRRCRPDASPGSPEWHVRTDVVARAMRLVADGTVDREGVGGLARRLGYSVRQLQRICNDELGAGPLAIARAQRAQTARVLIETTDLTFARVAFGAGFDSIRQFNDTVREVFARTPTELRERAFRRDRGRPAPAPAGGAIALRLPFREPATLEPAFGRLVATAVPGLEEWRRGAYRRTLTLGHGVGIAELRPGPGYVGCVLRLGDVRDLAPAVARCRALLDLDADPVAVDELLGDDPVLAPLVAKRPGIRVPRTVDGAELAIRAVLGQQISTAAARTHTARLVRVVGAEIDDPDGGLTHAFPTPAAIASAPPTALALPTRRAGAVRTLARALADGTVCLDAGADRDVELERLGSLAGIGPWTVAMTALRGLGDPDAFPAGDLGVRTAAHALGIDGPEAHAERWRPWRAYATQHLWASLDHPINHLPEDR